jgi:hypothetical protein
VGFRSPARPQPPTPEQVTHFVKTSLKYGYVLGTPEENATVGIDLPPFFAANKAFTA